MDAPAPGRDARGRFVRGHTHSRGNRGGRSRAEARRALLGAIGDDDLTAISSALVRRARAGDPQCLRLVLEFLCGRATAAPSESLDPDLPPEAPTEIAHLL